MRALEGRSDPIATAQRARLGAAIAARLLATYRLPVVPTTDANRWQGLEGFPNYPGPGWKQDATLNQRVVSA
jgi:magnesium-protoporphyrin IX monomethyl ester (oxidative) cyclase